MIDNEELVQLRIDIWDFIYQSGPCQISQIADEMKISVEQVRNAVTDDWFTVKEELVSNAVVP